MKWRFAWWWGIAVLVTLFPSGVSAIPADEIRASLWPPADYAPTLMVAGAIGKARNAYGIDMQTGAFLDVGALRDVSGSAEVLTPGGWVEWSETWRYFANIYARVGPGWSFGNNSVHNAARPWFEQVYGRPPNEMENVDIQYSGVLWERLRHLALGDTPPPPPPPTTGCGYGGCEVTESCSTCPQDCGVCPPPEPPCEPPFRCLPVLDPPAPCPELTLRMRETIRMIPTWGAVWQAARKQRVRELNQWATEYQAVEQSTGCLTLRIR